jgi:spermidine synthase
MPRPFALLDSVATEEGPLELRRRGNKDFMITVGGRVLMTSQITASELALARVSCAPFAAATAPRILIGGLGLGFTLRAALDVLPQTAVVVVFELHAKVIDWCTGSAAAAAGEAALDHRTRLVAGDVTHEVRRVAENARVERYDAILWDLYVGPKRRGEHRDPLYGTASVANTYRALQPGGVFAVWGETPSAAFEQRLRREGFATELVRTGGAGLKHAVFLARKPLRASAGLTVD